MEIKHICHLENESLPIYYWRILIEPHQLAMPPTSESNTKSIAILALLLSFWTKTWLQIERSPEAQDDSRPPEVPWPRTLDLHWRVSVASPLRNEWKDEKDALNMSKSKWQSDVDSANALFVRNWLRLVVEPVKPIWKDLVGICQGPRIVTPLTQSTNLWVMKVSWWYIQIPSHFAKKRMGYHGIICFHADHSPSNYKPLADFWYAKRWIRMTHQWSMLVRKPAQSHKLPNLGAGALVCFYPFEADLFRELMLRVPTWLRGPLSQNPCLGC